MNKISQSALENRTTQTDVPSPEKPQQVQHTTEGVAPDDAPVNGQAATQISLAKEPNVGELRTNRKQFRQCARQNGQIFAILCGL